MVNKHNQIYSFIFYKMPKALTPIKIKFSKIQIKFPLELLGKQWSTIERFITF